MRQDKIETMETILTKMFEMVGDTYTEDKTKGQDWYLKHTWTTEKNEEFIEWLMELFKSKKARSEIFVRPGRGDKLSREKAARMLDLMYGWKVGNECTHSTPTKTEDKVENGVVN